MQRCSGCRSNGRPRTAVARALRDEMGHLTAMRREEAIDGRSPNGQGKRRLSAQGNGLWESDMASAIGECVVKATRKAGQGMPGQWLVKCRGEEVGLIEQWAGSGQPWMAYYPIGMLSRKVGSFWGH